MYRSFYEIHTMSLNNISFEYNDIDLNNTDNCLVKKPQKCSEKVYILWAFKFE